MSTPKISSREISRRSKRHSSRGMGLIELMIAMAILSVGLLGSMIMMITGMESNSRNKRDNGATILDQEILETFATLKNYPNTGTVTINDCALTGSNSHLASIVTSTGSYPTGTGAALVSTGNAYQNVGDIDWTQAAPTLATGSTSGYAMDYQTCGGDIYEVRWNIMDANSSIPAGSTSRISLLTVSSRLTANVNGQNAMLFAQPVTLRTMIESQSY